MNTKYIRVKLHDIVDTGDEKLLELMHSLALEYSNASVLSFFGKEDIELFEERRMKRLNGESKFYNWKEAKEIITGKKI